MDRGLRAPALRRRSGGLILRTAALAAALSVALSAAAQEPAPVALEPPDEGAVLQGLDKVTARISTFDAPTGYPIRFGTLEITVRACHNTPPEEPPESTAYLEVIEVRPDEMITLLFQGWMFASSPALSALEHSVYDVWVIDCMKSANSSSRNPG